MNRVRLVYAILLSFCVGATLIVLGARKPKMRLKSEAFEYGGRIPKQYTCDVGFALNESPPLEISGVSPRAKSLVLIFENPESETGRNEGWTHWLVFNLPPNIAKLPAGVDIAKFGGVVGKNSVNRNEYSAICPAGYHSYYFRLYALDKVLDLAPSADAQKVRAAMAGHIIAETDLMGKYEREKRPELIR